MQNLQQIANTRLHREDTRPRQIRAKPPRHALQPPPPRRLHHLDALIHTPHRQRSLLSLLAAGPNSLPLAIRLGLAGDEDVAAIERFVVPFSFDHVAVGLEESTDDCEDDEEDAGSCVAGCGGWHPGGGEEGGAVVVGEDH